MGRLSDLAIQLEEAGIPDEIYRDATVSDALRLINGDSIGLVKVNGRWAVGSAIFIRQIHEVHQIPVRVV